MSQKYCFLIIANRPDQPNSELPFLQFFCDNWISYMSYTLIVDKFENFFCGLKGWNEFYYFPHLSFSRGPKLFLRGVKTTLFAFSATLKAEYVAVSDRQTLNILPTAASSLKCAKMQKWNTRPYTLQLFRRLIRRKMKRSKLSEKCRIFWPQHDLIHKEYLHIFRPSYDLWYDTYQISSKF